MAGWGSRLAQEGFVAVVPDLPTWFDHARNARVINELLNSVCSAPLASRVDRHRIALLGFSAGALATLIAAADNPAVGLWVGLDPIDQDGLGISAAPKLTCPAVILRAEASRCNAHGKAVDIQRAVRTPCRTLLIPGSKHLDLEWPTDWLAEFVCGRSSQHRRDLFVEGAVAALKAELSATPPKNC